MDILKVGEDQHPILFGFLLIRKIMQKHKLSKWSDWTVIPGKTDMNDMPRLVHSALESGADAVGEEFTLTIEDVTKMLNLNPWIITRVWEIFMHQMTPPESKAKVDKAVQEATEEVIKGALEEATEVEASGN